MALYTSNVSSLNNDIVAQFLIHEKLSESKLRQQVPLPLFPYTLSYKFKNKEGRYDTVVCRPNENEKYTCTSACEKCRYKENIVPLNTYIWNRYLPFKMSFLL